MTDNWDTYGVCPCGRHYKAHFGKLFFMHEKVCGDCGTGKEEWELRTDKWISTSVWWNPTTWGDGYWVTKG